ncbi:MAG TPA: acetoacetyl-CoA reductase [Gemmatimonadales bacterium]|nr:acetoacetyl-CoA reductase [Gemmatimonadales bacterium]
MHTSLKGRVALVTGGTGAIGTAICRRLAGSEARVVATYRDPSKAERWAAERKAEGLDIGVAEVDVTSFESCQAMVREVEQRVGPVDILVNNAGVTRDTTFRKMSKDQWDCVLSSNLDSLFNVSRSVIGGMLERGYGRIINISSINGEKGQFGQVNYSAAKAGIHGFTMALAQEVARKGITVNTVSPGYIATEMAMAVPEEIRNKITAEIPIGRMGTPEEVAYVVDFLAAPEAGLFTGSNLSCNGGHHMM